VLLRIPRTRPPSKVRLASRFSGKSFVSNQFEARGVPGWFLIPLGVICHSHFACTMQLRQAVPKTAFLILLPFLHSPAAQRARSSPRLPFVANVSVGSIASTRRRVHHFRSPYEQTSAAVVGIFQTCQQPKSRTRSITSSACQSDVGGRVSILREPSFTDCLIKADRAHYERQNSHERPT
jgi:hypothetical protein